MIDHNRAAAALQAMGLETSADNIAHLCVLGEALEICISREEQRGSLWKASGYKDNAHHLKSKASRVSQACEMDVAETNEARDEAIDSINYAVFFVRNSRAGRKEDRS